MPTIRPCFSPQRKSNFTARLSSDQCKPHLARALAASDLRPQPLLQRRLDVPAAQHRNHLVTFSIGSSSAWNSAAASVTAPLGSGTRSVACR